MSLETDSPNPCLSLCFWEISKFRTWQVSAPGVHVYIYVVNNYAEDEGRPLGAGLQEQASNHLQLHWSRAVVVSVKGKSEQRILPLASPLLKSQAAYCRAFPRTCSQA